MKTLNMICISVLTVLVTCNVLGIRYVSPSGSDTPPYDTWAKAAHVIQDAIDAAGNGELVLVTNGTYSTGGAITPGWNSSNRVVVTRGIVVSSVNSRDSTVIMGAPDPATGSIGTNAVRCAYVADSAVLNGFTLSNGYTSTAGHWLHDGSGGGVLIASDGLVSKCLIAENSASGESGGGVACYLTGTVQNTTISDNRAISGGGVFLRFGGKIEGCLVNGNSAIEEAGGIYCNFGGLVSNCIVIGNLVSNKGGGVYFLEEGMVENCIISANSAFQDGGGAYFWSGGTLRSCLLGDNSATGRGGGVYVLWHGLIENCTISDNSAGTGGGVYAHERVTNVNNIIYFNTANSGPNYTNVGAGSSYIFCCTTPAVPGEGNITADPEFVDRDFGAYYLLSYSPCIDTGTNMPWMWSATDIQGSPRIIDGIVDMGAFEFIPEPVGIIIILLVSGFVFTRNRFRC